MLITQDSLSFLKTIQLQSMGCDLFYVVSFSLQKLKIVTRYKSLSYLRRI